ncbi:MAG TPA: efflux RND transporter periplasmic adaptor subunit [Candidatus Acidoferrum sp.]|jgi:HlyD family secretion protein|nr:efflux RND transporter periplasmic adaptor subunit [Candidatus Acidoferrum sp.]
MQRFLKTPFVAILIVILAGMAGAWSWHIRKNSKSSFRAAVVKRGDVAASISASGTIEPEEVVDVGAQVAGLIKSFGTDIDGKPIDYGSVIEEGAILARIDESVYAADLAVAKAQMEQDKAAELSADANLDQMRARLIQAQAEWKRAQELDNSKLLARVDFDTAQANYEVAKANVAVAEAAVAQARAATVQAQAGFDKAQRNLDFCIIKSPVKGVIIDRRVNIGQTVVASLNAPSLFLIAKDLTRMQIWVAVNEADIGRIIPGAPVTFTCDAFPGREFMGTVGKVRLNATMTQNVVMYTVEVNTENSDNVLLPYLTANVHFVTRKESNVLSVPNAALRWAPSSLAQISPDARSNNQDDPPGDPPGGSKSSKQNKGSKERLGTIWLKDGEFVRPLEVKLGASDGSNTAVAAGDLQEGQEVVTGETADSAQTATKNPFLPQIRRR